MRDSDYEFEARQQRKGNLIGHGKRMEDMVSEFAHADFRTARPEMTARPSSGRRSVAERFGNLRLSTRG